MGVFLGIGVQQKNWDGVFNRFRDFVGRWSCRVRDISYRGRVLLVHQFLLPKFLYVARVVPPPADVVVRLQRLIISFVWSGRHWVHSSVCFRPHAVGGLALVHLESRLRAAQVQMWLRYLEGNSDNPAFAVSSAILRNACGAPFCRELIFLSEDVFGTLVLPPFYQAAVHAWFSLNPVLRLPLDSVAAVGSLPLRNSFLSSDGVTVHKLWATVGIWHVSDLLSGLSGSWRVFTAFALPATGSRQLFQNLKAIHVALLRLFPAAFAVGATRVSSPFSGFKFFSVVTGDFVDLSVTPKAVRAVYSHFCSSAFGDFDPVSYWRGVLPAATIPGVVPWIECYRPPACKRDGDLRWRFLHGRLCSAPFFQHIGLLLGPQCPWCGHGTGSVIHLFVECSLLRPTQRVLRAVVRRLYGSDALSLSSYIFGFPRGACRQRSDLANFLLGVAFGVFHRAFVSLVNNGTAARPLLAWFRLVLAQRLRLEFEYHRLSGTLRVFRHRWCFRDALCSLHDGVLVCHF